MKHTAPTLHTDHRADHDRAARETRRAFRRPAPRKRSALRAHRSGGAA